MKDLPLTWRQFLRILVNGIATPGEGADPAVADTLRLLEFKDEDGNDRAALFREKELQTRIHMTGLETKGERIETDNSLPPEERQRQKETLQAELKTARKEVEKASDGYWKAVLAALKKVKGYNLGGIEGLRTSIGDETTLDDDLKQQSPEKRLFFLIEYGCGEMIMQNGAYSDYAALHEQGVVRVWLDAPRAGSGPEKSCWNAPRSSASVVPRTWLGKALSRLLPFGRHEKPLATAPYEETPDVVGSGEENKNLPGKELPGEALFRSPDFAKRLMGVTSVVWKQPRTATLLADNDKEKNPCRMVLIKRIFLQKCLLFADRALNQPTPLYLKKVDHFLDQSLPDLLAQNRLFRPLFYVEEVENWEALLNGLAGKTNQTVSPAQRRIEEGLPNNIRKWLRSLEAARLEDADRYRVVSALNDFLDRSDLHDEKAWPAHALPQEVQDLLAKGTKERTVVETYRMNRLLIEAAFSVVFRSVREFRPRTRADFVTVVDQIRNNSSAAFAAPQRPREGEVIFEKGKSADGLYLILEGRVRLNLGSTEKPIVFNHLVENGFFGESCIEQGADPPHLYQAEALTNCNLLKIERQAVLALAGSFADFNTKLLWEAGRMRRRAEQVLLGRRAPPEDMSPKDAAKLMRATNLLVIDIDRCTRCDQCVQACTESHQGHPRFHRANPEFRIGRFEVAGACVHCSDAPCLEVCPVGAITLLQNGSVQVLRDRCISCRLCEKACPFGVIEYHPPIDPADGASAKKEDYVVSHKCDLCLTPERDPPCVVACPYGAAKRGAPSEFFRGLKSMARFTDPE